MISDLQTICVKDYIYSELVSLSGLSEFYERTHEVVGVGEVVRKIYYLHMGSIEVEVIQNICV